MMCRYKIYRLGAFLLLIKQIVFCSFAWSLVSPEDDRLPSIGPGIQTTLTWEKEKLVGDWILHGHRNSAFLLDDQMLTYYSRQLGSRLAANAKQIPIPVRFYVHQEAVFNAFAQPGAIVVLFTSLFNFSKTESELAAVLAHEISHVTQRHMTQYLVKQKKESAGQTVGIASSIGLSLANPVLGFPVLLSVLAAITQSTISFVQQHEREADALGIKVMSDAGFDPYAAATIWQRVSASSSTDEMKAQEFLRTHPVNETRIYEAKQRAENLPRQADTSSLDYWLAKMRVFALYSNLGLQSDPLKEKILFYETQIGKPLLQLAGRYGKALVAFKKGELPMAKKMVGSLLEEYPDNLWFSNLMTDIDLLAGTPAESVLRLKQRLQYDPANPVLSFDLSRACLSIKNFTEARQLLTRYLKEHPEELEGWRLLSEASAKLRLRSEELIARAEERALQGAFDEATAALAEAGKLAGENAAMRARCDARIDQLNQLKERYKALEKEL